MSLDNLARIGRLEHGTPSASEIQDLLASARRTLPDAYVPDISDETRFDVAYEVITKCAMVGLLLHGFRPAGGARGHHQLMIQSLTLTLDVSREDTRLLDGLRLIRNRNDYEGAQIDAAAARDCVTRAEAMLQRVLRLIERKYPELMAAPI